MSAAAVARRSGERDEASALRLLFVALAALSIGATFVELAMERHWSTFAQVIPFVVAGALVVALLLVAVRPGVLAIRVARLLAAAACVASLYGVYEHVHANYNAGPLDFRYARTWDSMSEASRWWKAATKGVGPSPVLAPGILAEAAFCIMAATYRHPATRKEQP